MPDPSARVSRRFSLTLDVEADDLEVLRQAAARALARFAIGVDAWSEEGETHEGELRLTRAPETQAPPAGERLPQRPPTPRTREGSRPAQG